MAYTSKVRQYVENDRLLTKTGGIHVTGTIAAGATKTLDNVNDTGKTVLLDTAAGSVVTLPAATGSQVEYTFVVSTLATSNSHKIQVANASDIMVGKIAQIDTDSSDAIAFFATTSTSDTITLNRSTTGSVRLGETIKVKDVATNRWLVDGMTCITGSGITPFSAAVS